MQRKSYSDWLFRIALAINIGIALSYIGLGVIAIQQDLLWRADFTMLYTGASIVRDGLGEQLYELELQSEYQQAILEGKSFSEGLLPFNYPPHTALVFKLFAHFSRTVALVIWSILQLGLLLWLLILLWRFSSSWTGRERLLLVTGALAFLPLFYDFLLGALSLLILVCLMQWYLALKERHDGIAGVWLTVASLKPQPIVLPVLVQFFARRWRALVATLLGGGVILILCSLLMGMRIWGNFVAILRQSALYFDEYGFYPADMYNLKGILAVWLGKEYAGLINIIVFLGFILSIGINWWLWRGLWQPQKPDFDLRMSITLTLGLLLGMHVYPQDALILVLSAALFYAYLRQENLPRQAYAIFLCLCPPLFLISEFTIEARLGMRLPLVAMLVLLGWQVGAFRRQIICKPTISEA